MTSNQTELRKLMKDNSEIATYSKLANFLGASIHTIHAYLKPVASKSHRPIPDKKLSELKKKIECNNAK